MSEIATPARLPQHAAIAVAGVFGVLFAVAVVLWVYYGTAVFTEMILAGRVPFNAEPADEAAPAPLAQPEAIAEGRVSIIDTLESDVFVKTNGSLVGSPNVQVNAGYVCFPQFGEQVHHQKATRALTLRWRQQVDV